MREAAFEKRKHRQGENNIPNSIGANKEDIFDVCIQYCAPTEADGQLPPRLRSYLAGKNILRFSLPESFSYSIYGNRQSGARNGKNGVMAQFENGKTAIIRHADECQHLCILRCRNKFGMTCYH